MTTSGSSGNSSTPASSHDSADWFEQRGFRVRFGWGPNGLRRLAPNADVVVVVDVLSFSTSVDIAVGRGAVILPYKWHDGSEHDYAIERDALVAQRWPIDDSDSGWTLAPSSLLTIPPGARLVLPSPNGSALTFGARDAGAGRVLVGCLRNAGAIASAVGSAATVSVIAAGERWRGTTGPLRPALEDQLGAGAIIDALGEKGELSPEAAAARAVYRDAAPELPRRLSDSGSGRELVGRGRKNDVDLAAQINTSNAVPELIGDELLRG